MLLLTDGTFLTRERVVEQASCPHPRCGAEAGSPCIGRRGPRVTAHVQRWNEWSRMHRAEVARPARSARKP